MKTGREVRDSAGLVKPPRSRLTRYRVEISSGAKNPIAKTAPGRQTSGAGEVRFQPPVMESAVRGRHQNTRRLVPAGVRPYGANPQEKQQHGDERENRPGKGGPHNIEVTHEF